MVWVLEQIKARTHREIFAVGVSLGGNALLKYLGENPNQKLINAAMAISVPFDLNETIRVLDQGFNKHVYVKNFLQTLLPKMKEYAKQFGNIELVDHKIDTLDEFNNTYICRFYGFKNATEYYEQTSCKTFLKNIATPTLILQAENDPMIPVSAWPNKNQLSKTTRFVTTKSGGHAGFINLTTNYKEAVLKLPKFMLQYFNQYTTDYPVNSDEFGQMELNFMGD